MRGRAAEPGDKTYSVILCAGTLLVRELPANARSLRRVSWFAAVSCQTLAVPRAVTPRKETITGVLAVVLLMTISVRAWSDERSAANAARLSGFATAAETLVSPKADFAPS